MTNTYEMMFILRPDLTGEQINKQLQKYRDFLKDNGAQKVSLEIWGKRRLAYPIQKFQDGVYVLTYYTGDGTQVAKVEKSMRLSEEVLRYLTIKQESDFEFEEKEIPELQVLSAEPKPVTPSSKENEVETTAKESENTESEEEVAVEA